MRIALLSPYAEPVKGGISSYTRELVKAYREMGLDVLALSRLGGDGAPFESLGPSRMGFLVRTILRMLAWKPDLVHAHSHWYTLVPGIVASWLLPHSKLLFTFHTPSEPGRAGWKDSLFLWLVSRSDGVAFVSGEFMETTGLPRSVNQGVVWAAPETAIVARSGGAIGRRDSSIVFVGPLVWPRKVAGVLLLLEAFAQVSPSFPGWHVVIIGDGPRRVEVERRVRELRIEKSVLLKGFVQDVSPAFTSAGIYAHISLQEGLPISLLNAMAAGAPVLATAIGGMAEVVEHRVTGYLCAPDLESVASGLRTMLEDAALRSKVGAMARDRMRRDFVWLKVAERCVALVTKGSV